jgi:hypothetical protein
MSVRPSVRMEQLGFHWTDFHVIGYLRIFRKSVEEIQGSLKWIRLKVLYVKNSIHFLSYLARFVLE